MHLSEPLLTSSRSTAPEILNDDYVFTNKLKVASKTEDGISYTINGVQNTKEDAIDADISAKAKIKGATVTGKAFTGGKLPVLEVKYETVDSDGRKVTLSGLGGKDLRIGNAELLTRNAGATIGANAVTSDVYGSLAIALTQAKISGFAVAGVEAKYSMSTREFSKPNMALSYFDGKESEVSLHVLDKMTSGMISYSHHVRQGFSVGAQMTRKFEEKTTTLSFGTAYRLDGATTVKGKIDSEGHLALSYIQDIRPNATLIMSCKSDVNKFDSAKVGLSLTVE